MPPSAALSFVYATADDVVAILSTDGLVGRLDDDESGTNSAGETAYLTKAIAWATARVNLFCLGKHAAQSLSESWTVNLWCSVIAAYFVSCRRGNPPAGSLGEMYEMTMEDLKAVKTGELTLADTATRDSAFPGWANVSAPSLYHRFKRLRVQVPISGRKGDQTGVIKDRASQIIGASENV